MTASLIASAQSQLLQRAYPWYWDAAGFEVNTGGYLLPTVGVVPLLVALLYWFGVPSTPKTIAFSRLHGAG
jgi:hypothetical protein